MEKENKLLFKDVFTQQVIRVNIADKDDYLLDDRYLFLDDFSEEEKPLMQVDDNSNKLSEERIQEMMEAMEELNKKELEAEQKESENSEKQEEQEEQEQEENKEQNKEGEGQGKSGNNLCCLIVLGIVVAYGIFYFLIH